MNTMSAVDQQRRLEASALNDPPGSVFVREVKVGHTAEPGLLQAVV
jgi:hypothetical protein